MAVSHDVLTGGPLGDRPPRTVRAGRRVPPNLFGIAFGLAGLGEAWDAARQPLGVPSAVPDAIFLAAAVAWLVLVVGYAAQGPRQVLADLRHPVLAPFVSLAVIIPMILATALATAAFTAGRILVMMRRVHRTVIAALHVATRHLTDYRRQDRVLAGQAAAILLAQLAAWLAVAFAGYALLLWPFATGGIASALTEAGSSLFTIGFFAPAGAAPVAVVFAASVTGLVIITLRVNYEQAAYAVAYATDAVPALWCGPRRSHTPSDPAHPAPTRSAH
jgi:hypothetical protein